MAIVDDLLLLTEIVKAGSLTAASRKTGIAKSTLSRRLDDLEKALGVRLIHRSPQRFSPTEIGRELCEHGAKIQDELGNVWALVEGRTRTPAGTLQIACPAVLSEMLVADFAISFAKQYPGVRLILDTSSGSFQAKMDHYDIAIQPARETLADSELVRRKLAETPYALVGAPSLFDANHGLTPGSLKDCAGIGWAADNYSSRWKLFDSGGRPEEFDVRLTFSANNLNVVRRAALGGLGLARLPRVLCEADVKEGRLLHPLPDWSPASVTIYALYSSRRSLNLAGTLFIAGLTRHLKESPLLA
jgi:DNA-binding transcriptional LysR family regulator